MEFQDESGVFVFRLEGKISCSAENLVGVLTDDKYRKEWDEYVHTMESIDPDVDGNECIYWRVKFPMPMTDREYVYYRKKVETKPPAGTTPLIARGGRASVTAHQLASTMNT